jgi:hypothetical protein
MAAVAAVSGSLPGWTSTGDWLSGNLFASPNDAASSSLFRFRPWTRKADAAPTAPRSRSTFSDDCTQNVPGFGSDGTFFSVRRNVCAEKAAAATDSTFRQPTTVREAPPVRSSPAAAPADESEPCTRTVEVVGPGGQIYAVRKNVCSSAVAAEVSGTPASVQPPASFQPSLSKPESSPAPAAAVFAPSTAAAAPATSTPAAADSAATAPAAADPTATTPAASTSTAAAATSASAADLPSPPAVTPNCFETVEVSRRFT